MKRKNLLIKIIPILLFFFSCSPSENEKLIVGSWSGVEWVAEGNPSGLNAKDTHFTFDEKGNYTFEYSGNKEAGTYKVENDMLFTKPANEQEIMVKIMKLTNDSLVFNMNRSGNAETLTLVRK